MLGADESNQTYFTDIFHNTKEPLIASGVRTAERLVAPLRRS